MTASLTASLTAAPPQASRPIGAFAALIALNIALIAHMVALLASAPPEFTAAAQAKNAVALAAAAGLIGLALWRARLGRRPAWGAQAHAAYAVAGGGLLLGLALVPVPPQVAPNLAHAHALFTLMITLVGLYPLLFDGDLPARARPWLIAAVGLAAVVLVLRIIGLAYHPFVDIQDEPWVTAWTLNFLLEGRFGDPTLAGLGDAYYAYPRYFLLMAGWVQLFGVGLWPQRLLGLLLTLPLIGFSAAAARNLYGPRAAWLTAAALFASAIVLSAARVRHDIGLALCVAAALWLHTRAVRRNQTGLHFLGGLAAGLGMFAHYHAAAFGAALLIGLYLPGMIARRRLDLGAVLFGLGGAAGFAAVVLLQMLPDDLNGWFYIITRISKYSDSSYEFIVSLFGNLFNIGWFSIFEAALLAVGVGAALRRRRRADVSLLVALVVGHVLLAVMASGAIYYYILPLTPVYGLLIGAALVRRDEAGALQAEPVAQFRRGELVVFALLLLPLLGGTTARPLEAASSGLPLQPSAPPAAAWVLANVPPDQAVAGDLYLYFWLHGYPFASHLISEYLYPENEARYPTIDAVWEAAAPAYLIIDPAYERSYKKYFAPLLATGWVSDHYDVVIDFDDAVSRAVIYRRTRP